MPEANLITFTNKELLEMLIKQADVHEGRWMLATNFGFTVGNFGPTNEQSAPGAVVIVNHMGIQKAAADTPIEMSLDAAVVNPSSASSAKRRPKRNPRQD